MLALFLGGFYGKVFLRSNEVIFDSKLDGYKNYYTTVYHVKFDSSYSRFQGMHYPWGDQVIMPDCQPLVSNSLKFFSRYFFDVSDWTIGIMNWLMLLSLFPTAFFLYKILRLYEVDEIYAAFTALGIALLSPQVLRWMGHYSLGYAFIIPLNWFLFSKFFLEKNIKYSFYLCASLFLSAWIHPYYLGISFFMLTALWFFSWMADRLRFPFSTTVFHWGIQVLVPLVIFQLILYFSDSVSDRPGNPYGLMEYRADWKSIFLPFSLYGFHPLDWFQNHSPAWEGLAYVGLTGMLLAIYFSVKSLFFLFQGIHKKMIPDFRFMIRNTFFTENLKNPLQQLLLLSVGCGIVLLLFSMAFPFSIKENLLSQIFPPIRQFRSLGRFAWVFYYIWSVFAFIQLFYFFKSWKAGLKYLKSALTLVPFFILFTEVILFHLLVSKNIGGNKQNLFRDDGQFSSFHTWLKNQDPEKYSSALILPSFHQGSENLGTANEVSAELAFRISLDTGLPLMNSYMNRSSLNETWKHFQLLGFPYRPYEIISDFAGIKPVLIVHQKMSGYVIRKNYILSGLSPVFSSPEADVFELDLSAINQEEILQKEIQLLSADLPDSTLSGPQNIGPIVPDSVFRMNHFSEGDVEGYRGKGISFDRQSGITLFDETLRANPGDTIIISVWVKMKEDGVGTTNLGLQEQTPDGKNIQWLYEDFGNHVFALDKKWALIEWKIIWREKGNRLIVKCVRWNSVPQKIVVDELLIRKKETVVFGTQGEEYFLNNLFFPLDLVKQPEKNQ